MNEALKPCPFCGGEAGYDHLASGVATEKEKKKHVVNCTVCPVSTSLPMHNKLTAAEYWNRRVNHE